jgi:DNA-binding NtrC family response regulator
LQENEYYPVGSDVPKKCEARIVVATNKSLKEQMAEGKFRKDLYYRLCSHQIEVPPLRERPDDLPLLFDYCIAKAAETMGKELPTVAPDVLPCLKTLPFAGNVRELEALVCDAVARSCNGEITLSCFPNISDDSSFPASCEDEAAAAASNRRMILKEQFGRFPQLAEIERWLIGEAMQESKGNQGVAAQLLGITRQTLNKRLGEIRREEKIPA